MNITFASLVRIAVLLALLLIGTFLTLPSVVLGQSGNEDIGATQESGLTNPLKSDSVTEFLLNIIDILLVFAIPIIVFFIMYGGYLLVTAQGEPAKLQQGRNAILWAVVGGVIILGANLILEIIKNTVESI